AGGGGSGGFGCSNETSTTSSARGMRGRFCDIHHRKNATSACSRSANAMPCGDICSERKYDALTAWATDPPIPTEIVADPARFELTTSAFGGHGTWFGKSLVRREKFCRSIHQVSTGCQERSVRHRASKSLMGPVQARKGV